MDDERKCVTVKVPTLLHRDFALRCRNGRLLQNGVIEDFMRAFAYGKLLFRDNSFVLNPEWDASCLPKPKAAEDVPPINWDDPEMKAALKRQEAALEEGEA